MEILKEQNLEKEYQMLKESQPKIAAEMAYALAKINQKDGNLRKAEEYAKESINLLEKLNLQTLNDCTTKYMQINNIFIPELLHERVAKERLQDLLK